MKSKLRNNERINHYNEQFSRIPIIFNFEAVYFIINETRIPISINYHNLPVIYESKLLHSKCYRGIIDVVSCRSFPYALQNDIVQKHN